MTTRLDCAFLALQSIHALEVYASHIIGVERGNKLRPIYMFTKPTETGIPKTHATMCRSHTYGVLPLTSYTYTNRLFIQTNGAARRCVQPEQRRGKDANDVPHCALDEEHVIFKIKS